MKNNQKRLTKYANFDTTPKETCFYYELQQLLSIKAAANKAGVK
jgi:hypothetical protein